MKHLSIGATLSEEFTVKQGETENFGYVRASTHQYTDELNLYFPKTVQGLNNVRLLRDRLNELMHAMEGDVFDAVVERDKRDYATAA